MRAASTAAPARGAQVRLEIVHYLQSLDSDTLVHSADTRGAGGLPAGAAIITATSGGGGDSEIRLIEYRPAPADAQPVLAGAAPEAAAVARRAAAPPSPSPAVAGGSGIGDSVHGDDSAGRC